MRNNDDASKNCGKHIAHVKTIPGHLAMTGDRLVGVSVKTRRFRHTPGKGC